MSENKIVKALMDASVVVGIAAGIGYIGKKAMSESFINDPFCQSFQLCKMGGSSNWIFVFETISRRPKNSA